MDALPRLLPRLLLAIACLLLAVSPGLAREEIRSFTSNLVLAADGTVDVTEILDVNAEGNQIRRGIYRDIPVVMLDDDGVRVRPALHVLTVMRGKLQEPFRTERMGDFIRIWIGDPDVLVLPGVHRYRINYTMTRMGRFFPDHDEVYWNATGNYWNFPILASIATVTLPDGARISDISGYTGEVGSTAQNVKMTQPAPNRATIRSTIALAPGEGLTYAVSFQKGILVPPSSETQFLYWLTDRQASIIPGLGALLTLIYFSLAWWRVGRDPKKGIVIPLFHPPHDVSPALAQYIDSWGWKNNGWTAFTAAIFNLGVKGLVQIDNAGDLKVTPTGRTANTDLTPAETKLFDYVRSSGGFTINKATGPTLNTKRSEFISTIVGQHGGVWFRNNVGYSLLGGVLALAMLGVMVWLGYIELPFLIIAVVAGVFIGGFGGTSKKIMAGNAFSKILLFGWIAIVGINMAGGALTALSTLRFSSATLAGITIVAATIIFAILMRAPTVVGRAAMDKIDGLKLYLETAEKNRLNMDKAPPMTVKRFEALLPFAIALGVEKPWSEHFQGELARNAVADQPSGGGYYPMWYSGSNFSANRFASDISTAATSMSAAMVAAQPVQSSSSGGGGGGSSGGGGGGGGGGGW
ncbi:DUF2207 domain-containing protein [Devosia rhodophyticola]|uniref:DUF2207 domain-containing protein n=1 Tax=Devosia rhodophyticola TaxID=3026423 RepID=A0ABY7YYQ1_9HYPH|nr:DUF2207 domain-containing protein [Devosia rhodophyticola]WDR06513.1 DUF2207 domain-containing protein [Devosia rhodophyticola]